MSYHYLVFVRRIHRGPVNSPHKWPVTRKMFSFDVIMRRFNTRGVVIFREISIIITSTTHRISELSQLMGCQCFFMIFLQEISSIKHSWPNRSISWPSFTLLWRHNEHDSVSNHHPHDCLLNYLFRRRSKKTSKPRVTAFVRGIHRSPHKWPVTLKMFAFDDVIMKSSRVLFPISFIVASLAQWHVWLSFTWAKVCPYTLGCLTRTRFKFWNYHFWRRCNMY